MDKKKTLRAVAIGLAAAVAAGGVAGGVIAARRMKPVNVYPVSELAQTDMWMDASSYEGSVMADSLQSVYVSGTQTVREIFVKEGDEVRKGDRLVSFDTTLSDLELDRQRITAQKTRLSLDNARAELARINSLRPYTPPEPEPEPEPPEPEPLPPMPLPYRVSGSGTEDDPFVFLWDESCVFDEAFIDEILPRTPEEEPTDAPGADDEEETAAPEETENAPEYTRTTARVILQTREYDNPRGALVASWGVRFVSQPDGGFTFSLFTPDGTYDGPAEQDEPEEPDEPPVIDEGGYTAAEIAEMRAEQQQLIRDLETQVKVEDLKLRKLELEISTGVVTAELDGTVRSVATEEDARRDGSPVVSVSAGGSWRISACVGELDLESLRVGDPARVESWMEYGSVCEGVVTEISQYPVSGGWYGGSGNPNVSYYPVTVEVPAEENLHDGDYVSVSFSASSGESGLFLSAPFVLNEGGASYVFVEDGRGRLEKRRVQTGRIFWGDTVEIPDGLSVDDYIAFPYGRDARDGARTARSDTSALYENYYF